MQVLKMFEPHSIWTLLPVLPELNQTQAIPSFAAGPRISPEQEKGLVDED